MQTQLEEKYKIFNEFHGNQLKQGGFPSQLIPILAEKLQNGQFDFAQYFQVQDNQNEDTFQVSAIQDIPKSQNVFIIEHQLVYKSDELRNILQGDQDLVQRLAYQLQYFGERKKIPGLEQPQQKFKGVEEYDSMDIIDPSTYKVNNTQLIMLLSHLKFYSFQQMKQKINQSKHIFNKIIPQNTISLSFFDNKIESIELVRLMLKEIPSLKVLFLNYNPICDDPNFKPFIQQEFPQIEILNSKLTSNAGEFGLKFCSYKYNLDKTNKIKTEMIKALDLSNREVLNMENFDVFSCFKNLQYLDIKKNKFDNEEDFQKLLQLLSKCTKLNSLLIDFELEMKLWDLNLNGKLKELCPTLEKVNDRYFSYQKPLENEEEIRYVTKNIWKCVGNFQKLGKNQAGETPTWFLNDLYGIAIQHSDQPNLRMIPFQYCPNNKIEEGIEIKSYSLVWPIHNIQINDIGYRDYLMGFDESKQRSARLTTWFQVPEEYFANCIQEYKKKLMNLTLMGKNQIKQFQKNQDLQVKAPEKQQFKVFTDSPLVKQHLNKKEFELTQDPNEADIVFLIYDLENNMKKYKTQLSEFVGEYFRRQNIYEDNIWIIKAFDLARSMDMIVTDNIEQIIRQMESLPRLAQKYIQNPLTIYKKKIDLRFMVAVKSIKPLEVFVYENFVIRTSNNNFTNDYRSREIYETHFTVMNYGGKKMNEIFQEEFIKAFEEENPQIKWEAVLQKIKDMVKELFIAVSLKYPQMHSEKSRSVYGMDVMIENGTYQPKILEMTYSPDSNRICKYYPTFYNELFSLFFMNSKDVKTFLPVI